MKTTRGMRFECDHAPGEDLRVALAMAAFEGVSFARGQGVSAYAGLRFGKTVDTITFYVREKSPRDLTPGDGEVLRQIIESNVS